MPTKRTWFGREYHVHDWGKWGKPKEFNVTWNVGKTSYAYAEPYRRFIQERTCEECGLVEVNEYQI